jgi:hypothetical protein
MTQQSNSSVQIAQKPTQWWLLLAAVLVLLLAFLFLNQPEEDLSCGRPLYFQADNLQNPLDSLSAGTTSLSFVMSGDQLGDENHYIAYWNIKEKGTVDSYIKNSGQACTTVLGTNSIDCGGLEFYFPAGKDEIIYELDLVNADEGCKSENVLHLEVLIDSQGNQQVLRLEGDFLPEE